MAKKTLYEILHVPPDASPEAITHAYDSRTAILLGGYSAADKHNQMEFLRHAYAVLGNPLRRAEYDRQLQAGAMAAQVTAKVAATAPTADQRPASSPKVLVYEHAAPMKWPLYLGTAFLIGLLWAGWSLMKTIEERAKIAAERDALTAQVQAQARAALERARTPPNKPTRKADGPKESNKTDIAADELPPLPVQTKTEVRPTDRAEPAQHVGAPQSNLVKIVGDGSPLLNKVLDSTYAIVGGAGIGSAVAVDTDRLLTNCHVLAPNIHKGKLMAINAATGAEHEVTEAAFLVKEDVCIVRVPGAAARPITLGDTRSLVIGARVHNIGFAGGRLTPAQGRYRGNLDRFGQSYMISTNYCAPGVSGGPLVDDDGRLIGLTAGGVKNSVGDNFCASLTVETARTVFSERMIQINAFPTNYVTNWMGRR